MRISGLIFAIIVGLLLAGCGSGLPDPSPTPTPTVSPTPSPLPSPPAKLFNLPTTVAFNVHLSYELTNHADIAAQCQLVRGLGGSSIRDMAVAWFNNKNGEPDYDDYQYIYDTCTKLGLTPLFIAPKIPAGTSLEKVLAFLQQGACLWPMAEWELMNEPNKDYATPALYWADAKPLAQAIRAGNSHAFIVTGGTSGLAIHDWQTPLIALLKQDGSFETLINAIGVHPYSETLSMLGPDYKTIKDMLPPKILIYATEYGEAPWPSYDLFNWIQAHQGIGIPYYSTYELTDNKVCDPGGKNCTIQNYGIYDINLNPRPSLVDAVTRATKGAGQ